MPVSLPRRYEPHQRYTPNRTLQIERDKQELFLQLISLDYRPQHQYSEKEVQCGAQSCGAQSCGVQSEEETATMRPILLKGDGSWSPQQYSTMMRTWADTSEICKPDGNIEAKNGIASKSVMQTKMIEPSMVRIVAQGGRQSGQVKAKEEMKRKERIPQKIAVIKVKSNAMAPPTGAMSGGVRWKVPEEQSEQQQNIFSGIAPIESRQASQIDAIKQEFQSYSSIFKANTGVADKPQQETHFVCIKVPRKPVQSPIVPLSSSEEEPPTKAATKTTPQPFSSIASSSSEEHNYKDDANEQHSLGLISVIKSKLVSLFNGEDNHSINSMKVEESSHPRESDSSHPRESERTSSKQSECSMQRVKMNEAEVKKMNNIVNESVKIVSVNLSKILKKQVPKEQVPKKQVPKEQVPKKQVPKKQVPKKQVPKKQVPKKQGVASSSQDSRGSGSSGWSGRINAMKPLSSQIWEKQSSQISNIESYSETVVPSHGGQSVKESYSQKSVPKNSESGYSEKARQRIPISVKVVKIQKPVESAFQDQEGKQDMKKEERKEGKQDMKQVKKQGRAESQGLERVGVAPARHIFKYDDLKEVQYSSDAISLSNIPSCSSSSRSVEAHPVSPLSVPSTFKDEDFDLDEVKDYSSSSEEDEQPQKLNVRVAQLKKKIVLQSVLEEDLEDSHYSPRKTPRILNPDLQQLELEFLSQVSQVQPSLNSHHSDQRRTPFAKVDSKSEEQNILADVKTDIRHLVAKMKSEASVKSVTSVKGADSADSAVGSVKGGKGGDNSDVASKRSFQVAEMRTDSAISSERRANILQEFEIMNSKVRPSQICLDLRRLATRIAAQAPQD